MSLILAEPKHYAAIKRLCLDFFNASPCRELGLDENRVDELIEQFVSGDKNQVIAILWEVDGEIVGILAGLAQKNLFNNRLMVSEVVWWIDPAHRKSRAAHKMLQALEYWAWKIDAQFIAMIDLMGNLSTFYSRKGYEQKETSYVKVL